MSVFVVRAFVRLREMLSANRQIAARIEELEQRLETHDGTILDHRCDSKADEAARETAPKDWFRLARAKKRHVNLACTFVLNFPRSPTTAPGDHDWSNTKL
jgi:hypothetical protein